MRRRILTRCEAKYDHSPFLTFFLRLEVSNDMLLDGFVSQMRVDPGVEWKRERREGCVLGPQSQGRRHDQARPGRACPARSVAYLGAGAMAAAGGGCLRLPRSISLSDAML